MIGRNNVGDGGDEVFAIVLSVTFCSEDYFCSSFHGALGTLLRATCSYPA
jgi:hypothetical protein